MAEDPKPQPERPVLGLPPNKSASEISPTLRKELEHAVCIVPQKIFFMTTRHRFRQTQSLHFFSIDNHLRYDPFFMDFGPLNLGCLFKFWRLLKFKSESADYAHKQIYFFCGRDEKFIANASYLIGCYMIIELGMHPSDACRIIEPISRHAQPFRDASMGVCKFDCLVDHCVWAVFRALQRNFLDFTSFNLDDYEYYERVDAGDLNILIPGKFIAFASPNATERDNEGFMALTPDFYLPIWKKFNVTTIIRLNKQVYDKRFFTLAGYKHYDLFYTDGTIPPPGILKKFLNICETEPGVIAVHCKAGLGRTGTCIGAYMMKHYRWTAEECIAWMRMCRPGSVIGPQQSYLQQLQPHMWEEGDKYRALHATHPDEDVEVGLDQQFADMSIESKEEMADAQAASAVSVSARALPTDPGQDQGGALLSAKRGRRSPRESAHHS